MKKIKHKDKNQSNIIVIGIVAPLGASKSSFISELKGMFSERKYDFQEIKLTNVEKPLQNLEKLDYDKAFKLFVKMQYCSDMRNRNCNSYMGCLAVKRIDSMKRKNSKKKIVYIIDQLKHPAEYKILSHVYGISYIQVSLFSNENHRDEALNREFKNDKNIVHVSKKTKGKGRLKDIAKYIKKYKNQILPNASHRLIRKDMFDLDETYIDEKSGQNVKDIFHMSHYFFNIDNGNLSLSREIKKFIQQLFGEYEEYPAPEEFGMALAYHGSYRSTFPHGRHVGASIISQNGEVIAVASIRAPTPSSNTEISHEYSIAKGYAELKEYNLIDTKTLKKLSDLKRKKDKVTIKFLKYFKSKNKENDIMIDRIRKSINEAIDFHPCTHAELSALADSAKLGVSVRGATLYTTTFPCHLCAKDIITFGIAKVVYLEKYPKSKNRDLYPELISFDDADTNKKIPFIMYSGVSPRRYHYVYSLDNKPKKKTYSTNDIPKYLKFEKIEYYNKRAVDVINMFDRIVSKKEKTSNLKEDPLYHLLKNDEE